MATSIDFLGALYEKSIAFLHTKAKAVFKKVHFQKSARRHWKSEETCYSQAGHFHLLNLRQDSGNSATEIRTA